MLNINNADSSFDFSKLSLNHPVGVQGGSYVTKIMKDETPLYILTPVCSTKQGVVRTDKKTYSDLMFNLDNSTFIEWIENLELSVQQLIFSKRHEWFENDLELADIENSFTPSLKVYKSGKFYLLRVGCPNSKEINTIKIFNESEEDKTLDDISIDTKLTNILEIQGVKFSSKNFQILMVFKQIMIMDDEQIFDKCLIKSHGASTVANESALANEVALANAVLSEVAPGANAVLNEVAPGANAALDEAAPANAALDEVAPANAVLDEVAGALGGGALSENTVENASANEVLDEVAANEVLDEVAANEVLDEVAANEVLDEVAALENEAANEAGTLANEIVASEAVLASEVALANEAVLASDAVLANETEENANEVLANEIVASEAVLANETVENANEAASEAAPASANEVLNEAAGVAVVGSLSSICLDDIKDSVKVDGNFGEIYDEENVEDENVEDENLNALEEIELQTSDLDNSTGVEIRSPAEVFYEIYKDAKEKAKHTRKEAIKAYLDCKQIRDSFKVNDLYDSDNETEIDMNNFY
jgi:hypothetical protein